MLAPRKSVPAFVVFFLVVAATIGIGVHQAVGFAVSNAVHRDGEVRLRQWAGYINSYLPDLEEIVATGSPTPEQDPDKLHGVLETIVALGHGLGMCVTAEGIETPHRPKCWVN